MGLKAPLIVVVFLTLLNGGVLGLAHRRLLAAMQPAARDWRIGTLLMAAGIVIQVMPEALPRLLRHTGSQAAAFLALTLYWRALRRFYGARDRLLLLLPVLAGSAAIAWFSSVTIDMDMRAMVSGAVWGVLLAGAARTLHRAGRNDASLARKVLLVLFAGGAAVAAGTVVYIAAWPASWQSIYDPDHWMSILPPIITAVVPVIGTTTFLLLCFEHIRRRWEEAASTDELTGLPNRRAVAGIGAARFAAARGGGRGFALAVIDVDHFKAVNDRHGHDTGDRALRHVAGILEEHCRGENCVGRQGGEEFVVLFDNADEAAAGVAAERLRHAMAASPFASPEGPYPITISLGVAVMHDADRRHEDLLQRADRALYAAKAAGRNCVKIDTGADTCVQAGPAVA